jgi:hypothetical protein
MADIPLTIQYVNAESGRGEKKSPFATLIDLYFSIPGGLFGKYTLLSSGAKNQMLSFIRKKESAVHAFIVALLNQNCQALLDILDGPRLEKRVNFTMVLMVVPLAEKKPLLRQAFAATTKEFSSCGVAVVLDRPRDLEEAFLGFRWRGGVVWIRAKAKHLHPMGGGFYQMGFRMTERLLPADHPELEKLDF